ncbi:response regulator transcription factor [Paenibacillus radicis (ex Gao et al. 2016)]|uniref:response regulator transcription factor n=1 Tax=Paenibacillus radicis (ex Gao et al. 2016) TaxID=1737354 RepID=UPI001E559C2A|nr:response regulator transcription factor [Paenibacillus radicis (ex Gao et al. 2016)]
MIVYKIVLVDDEAVVRVGIRDRIEWQSLGFECAADCENGVEALAAIERIQPDVVLTDINMPFMDGLELTQAVKARHPEMKVVILTGYDDFDYAQRAVKLKVNDFILKPITAAELTAVLQKIKAELDEQRKDKEELDRLQRQLRESMPVLKERFLDRLATSTIREGELAERLAFFEIELPGPDYEALAIDLDLLERGAGPTAAADRELLRFAIYNVTQELLSEDYTVSEVFRSREEKVMAILSGDQPELHDRAQELADKIRLAAEQFLRRTVSVGIGTPAVSLRNISESCQAAVSALEYRLLLGGNRVISISDMEPRIGRKADYSQEYDRRLIAGIKTGTADEVDHAVDTAINRHRTAMLTIDQSYIRLQRTLIAVMQALEELGCEEADVFGSGVNPLTAIYSFRTLDEISDWLKEACRRAVNSVAEARDDQCRQQMKEALAYIHDHYGDSELSVKTVSKQVLMSVSYFSAAFKSHTGKTFVEYLTAVRMDKAKEQLKFTGLRTYEIAAKSGYPDAQYFSVLFKKHTGDSPTEYRQKTSAERA